MNLTFTKEEKMSFLNMKGFQIVPYESEMDCDSLMGEKVKIKLEIVFSKNNIFPSEIETMDPYHLRQKYGLDEVFEQQFTIRLKEFLFRKL
jgi:hypothetical protein